MRVLETLVKKGIIELGVAVLFVRYRVSSLFRSLLSVFVSDLINLFAANVPRETGCDFCANDDVFFTSTG